MADPAVIEPVRRSFAVLEALSHRRTSTLMTLTAETGLPRPTVVRLLQTLIALGYAARISRERGYRLTDRVLGLSESIRFVDHLVDAAMPHMERFTRDHDWPLYLATMGRGAIVIRHSTATQSPLAFEGAGLNARRPILNTALGRVWLAFCSEEERRATLKELGGLPRRREAALETLLARVRDEGYAFTQPLQPTRLQGIAVPVMRRDGRMLASVSMRFPMSAMTEADVVRRFVKRLQTLARHIATNVAGTGRTETH
jgi:IclR family mhp operon transcriptional activator